MEKRIKEPSKVSTGARLSQSVEYARALLGNLIAIAGFVLAGLGNWVVSSIGLRVPPVLIPVLGVLVVAYAGYQLYEQGVLAYKSQVTDLQRTVDQLIAAVPRVIVRFSQGGDVVDTLKLVCHETETIDVDQILAEDRRKLQTIAENWTCVWSSRQLDAYQRHDYLESQTAFHLNLNSYLGQLRSDINALRQHESLVDQLKVIHLVATNEGRTGAEHIQFEIRTGPGMAFPTESQINDAKRPVSRIKASDYLTLRKVPDYDDGLETATLASDIIPLCSQTPDLPRIPATELGVGLVNLDRLVPGGTWALPAFTIRITCEGESLQSFFDIRVTAQNLPMPIELRKNLVVSDGYSNAQ